MIKLSGISSMPSRWSYASCLSLGKENHYPYEAGRMVMSSILRQFMQMGHWLRLRCLNNKMKSHTNLIDHQILWRQGQHPHGQRHQLQPYHCCRAGYRSGVCGQRLQWLAGCEDREPGRMGFRGVQRDHNWINAWGTCFSSGFPLFRWCSLQEKRSISMKSTEIIQNRVNTT